MVILKDKCAEAIRNRIRDESSTTNVIQKDLYSLGVILGQKISSEYFTEERTIKTPTESQFNGLQLINTKIVIVSTLDDYKYFANGLSTVFENVERGYIDFAGKRGQEVFSSPLRSITLPDIQNVNTVIIAKSVLATGCTAISLIKKAVENYSPQRLIIASVYYSRKGLYDVQNECKYADFFLIGEPDELRRDGMLIPGVGDLDKRIVG